VLMMLLGKVHATGSAYSTSGAMGRVPYLMVPRGTAEGRVHYLVVLMVLWIGYMLLVVLMVL